MCFCLSWECRAFPGVHHRPATSHPQQFAAACSKPRHPRLLDPSANQTPHHTAPYRTPPSPTTHHGCTRHLLPPPPPHTNTPKARRPQRRRLPARQPARQAHVARRHQDALRGPDLRQGDALHEAGADPGWVGLAGLVPSTYLCTADFRCVLTLPPPINPPPYSHTTATYKSGHTVELHVLVTTNHYGRFKFRVCPPNAQKDSECTNMQREDGKGDSWDVSGQTVYLPSCWMKAPVLLPSSTSANPPSIAPRSQPSTFPPCDRPQPCAAADGVRGQPLQRRCDGRQHAPDGGQPLLPVVQAAARGLVSRPAGLRGGGWARALGLQPGVMRRARGGSRDDTQTVHKPPPNRPPPTCTTRPPTQRDLSTAATGSGAAASRAPPSTPSSSSCRPATSATAASCSGTTRPATSATRRASR
jgi:hypothetical protein